MDDKQVWHINTRFNQGHWHPGWFDPQDRRMYFKKGRDRAKDEVLTNLHTLDDVPLSSIFVFNFKLRADHCLPREVAQTAIRRYRKMTITDTDAGKGPITYEDKLDDSLIENPHQPPLRWPEVPVIKARRNARRLIRR